MLRPPSPLLLASALALLATGCLPGTELLDSRCDLVLEAPEPAAAAAGETVVLAGTPLTSTWDTAVYVGGLRATVEEVDREDCTTCDDCREEQGCGECGDCDACDLECEETCAETIHFVVPAGLAPGAAEVQVFNKHGTGFASIEISAPDDTGGGDTGSGDTGGSDTGSGDTGGSDTGGSDTGSSDTGGSDTGGSDTGSSDTGSSDTGS